MRKQQLLREIYDRYANDYIRGTGSVMFHKMIDTISYGNHCRGDTQTIVFDERVSTQYGITPFDLYDIIVVGLEKIDPSSNAPPLLSLLCNTLSAEDFSINIDLTVQASVRIIVTWSLELSDKI